MASNETSVYLGIWTNWSHGAVAGLTYTTTLDKGGLFIAFLALFVTFSGTCFWSIISFAVHQTLSRQSPQDAIYHQRQAILRNADTSGTALWRFLTLTWAWRKISLAASIKSSSIPMLASLATFFAFAAAGIFSSQVATSRGSQVLVIGNKCSALNGSLITKENVALSQYYGASRIRSSFSYESNCYSRNGTEGCRTYVKDALPMKVTTDSSCPFPGKDAICHPKSGSITLDSGFINSNDDLGINAPPSSRFLYRTVNKCAPILSEGYFRNITTTPQKSIQYFYGTHMQHCGDGPEGCTFEVLYGEGFGSRVARNQYTVSAVTKWQVSPEQSYVVNVWEPIPELDVPDADISVLFLESNDIGYIVPVSDPWFKAQNGPQKFIYTSGNLTIYRGDQSARAVACVQQYQFCNPALPKNESCTPLMGIFEATRLASKNLFTQPNNKEAFQWTTLGIQNMANGFTEIITTLRGGALLASDTLAGIGQYGLPDNQWAIELQHWFRTTLADLQRTIVDQATGPTDPKVVPVWSPPRSAEARTVCNNQKIRSDSYTSFNVLGLTIVFSIGGLIMLISAFLPDVTARVQRNRKPFSSLEWASNDTLQLQRLAHEAVGSGEWEGACDDYPLTRKNDLLAELDITNKKHPILRAQTIVEKITERDLKNKATDGERYFLGRIESGMGESVQESLLSVKIPRTSLDFPHRLPV